MNGQTKEEWETVTLPKFVKLWPDRAKKMSINGTDEVDEWRDALIRYPAELCVDAMRELYWKQTFAPKLPEVLSIVRLKVQEKHPEYWNEYKRPSYGKPMQEEHAEIADEFAKLTDGQKTAITEELLNENPGLGWAASTGTKYMDTIIYKRAKQKGLL